MTAVENAKQRAGYTGRTVRAAVLVKHPAQHFAPGFRLLEDNPEIHARVYFWDSATDGLFDRGFDRHVQWTTDLHSGYDWWAPPAGKAWRRRLAVLGKLRKDRPDVLLCFGWASVIARLGILFALLTKTPLLYYGDTNWHSSASGRHLRIRAFILRTLFRGAAGAVSTGTFNREFYIFHGLAPQRIHPGVYPTDVESFSLAGESRRPTPSDGNDKPLVIGFAGKFLGIKGVDDLVAAASRLPRDRPWELWLIGDGPLRAHLEAIVDEHGLGGRVRFLGFRNTDEIPRLMSAIDVMVMPSRLEPRGLVAVEAMAAGAATIVSSATGLWGAGDIVQHEETGLVYPVRDVGALTGCLMRLMEDPELREKLSTSGRARALSFGPRDFADTAAAALVSTVRRGGRVALP